MRKCIRYICAGVMILSLGATAVLGFSAITQSASTVPLDLPRIEFYEQMNDAVYALTATDVPALVAAANELRTNALANGKVFIGDASGKASQVTPSGAWTIATNGVATMEANAVTNETITAYANITAPKLAVTAGTHIYGDANGHGALTPVACTNFDISVGVMAIGGTTTNVLRLAFTNGICIVKDITAY